MSTGTPIVIVVEDEAKIRRFVRLALEAEALEVYEADSVARGLIEVGTRQPDLVVLDLGTAQLAGDLAQMGLQHLFQLRLGRGFFLQDDLTDHRLDIGIGQLNWNLETTEQTLQIRHTRQGALAGGNKQQLVLEDGVLAAGFYHFLDLVRLVGIRADVLLHLIEHHQGERELTLRS